MDLLLSNKGNFYYLVICMAVMAISGITSFFLFRSKQKNIAVIALLVFAVTTLLFAWSVYMLVDDHQSNELASTGQTVRDSVNSTVDVQDGTARYYEFKVQDQEENLELNWGKDQTFQFVLTLNNSETGCNNIVNGKAVAEPGEQDLDLDTDENGLSYPAKEYIYETDSCRLSFRIAVKDCSRVNVICGGCGETGDCPMLSTGTLKLIVGGRNKNHH